MHALTRSGSIFVLLAAVTLAACAESPPDLSGRWQTALAFRADTKLGGCAVGDLDPRHAGNEIASVALDGQVHVTRSGSGGWVTEHVTQLPGEGIQCAIGDVDPSRPGNELVVVGMAEGTEEDGGKGAVHLVFLDDDEWRAELILEDSALVHGVGIGDADPERAGAEVVVTGFSGTTRVLACDDGTWTVRAEHPLPEGAGKSVMVVDGRIHVANTSDALASIPGPDVEIGAPQARLGHGAEHVVVACDDGALRMVAPEGVVVLHREAQKLRGAALGDLDPGMPGEEAATVGYEKKLSVLYRPAEGDGPWTPVTLWEDTAKLHHLATGELLTAGAGPELVAVGYSGNVIVAWCTGR